MVTILITAAVLALVAWAFKVFWKGILAFVAGAIFTLCELIAAFVKFVRRNGKAVAYLIRHYFSGRKTREQIDEIDEELCPDEVQEALKDGKEVRVHNIK